MILAQDLRDAVLQAAIQGKLTQQLASDSSVDELLEQIRTQKELLIKEKKIYKDKEIIELDNEKFSIDLPENWKLVNLQSISTKITDGEHKTPKRIEHNEGYYLLSARNIRNNDLQLDDVDYVAEEVYDIISKRCNPQKNDILISCSGSVGRCCVINDDNKYVMVRSAAMISCKANSYYIMYVIQSPFVQSQIDELKKESVQANLFQAAIASLLIPLPPLEEQQRIVERVSELMAKIDEFEKIEKQLSAIKKAFPQDMKDALLQAAMQGKLTEQLPSDSSVDDLLETIHKEKEQLIKEKKIKKEKPLKPISEDEIPFDIPDSWRWVRLRDIVYNREQKKPSDKFSYIDIGSIDNVHQKLSNDDNIVEAKNAPSRARKTVKFGDIIYATVRPYLHNTCIIDRKFQYEPIASTGFAVLTCHTGIVNKYLLLYLLSPQFDKYANDTDNAKGIAYPAINDQKLYQAVIPLPPIEEQRRIVQTLEKMLAACEGL